MGSFLTIAEVILSWVTVSRRERLPIMKELFRTTNRAEIALVKSVLAAADIKVFLFDENTNSLGVMYSCFAPCRFMVLDDEYVQANEILKEYKSKIEEDNEPSPTFSARMVSNILVILVLMISANLAIAFSNYIAYRRYMSRRNGDKEKIVEE